MILNLSKQRRVILQHLDIAGIYRSTTSDLDVANLLDQHVFLSLHPMINPKPWFALFCVVVPDLISVYRSFGGNHEFLPPIEIEVSHVAMHEQSSGRVIGKFGSRENVREASCRLEEPKPSSLCINRKDYTPKMEWNSPPTRDMNPNHLAANK